MSTFISSTIIDKPEGFPDHWPDKLKCVLTCGSKASQIGHFKGDVAVYCDDHTKSDGWIMSSGHKLTHKMSNKAGYSISEEDYRR